jgi:hypothetical protein
MSDAEQPTPERYREAAEKLRQLAGQSPLPDVQKDLLDLAAHFERMAAYLDAQRRLSAPRNAGKE